MLTLKRNIIKYKDSNGLIQDIDAIIGRELTDITLTKSGVGADSKVVGDKFITLESELENYYLKTEADNLHAEIEDYVDNQVAALVNAAPETLDTLGELAAAFEENKEVVEVLDASITNKQDKVSNTLILVDTVTGVQHKIQIQNGQLVSFPVEQGAC